MLCLAAGMPGVRMLCLARRLVRVLQVLWLVRQSGLARVLALDLEFGQQTKMRGVFTA